MTGPRSTSPATGSRSRPTWAAASPMPQIAELSQLDAGSWLHLQAASVDLVAGLAAAGLRLAVLSNAPEDTAQAVSALPVAAHFEHLMFSCYLKSGQA